MEGNRSMSGLKRSVAQVFPPGDFIREELDARGWTQRDLAEILGRPTQAINAIINAKKEVTPETAVALGAALGTSPGILAQPRIGLSIVQGWTGRSDHRGTSPEAKPNPDGSLIRETPVLPADLKRAVNRQPFEPFRLILRDGFPITVRAP